MSDLNSQLPSLNNSVHKEIMAGGAQPMIVLAWLARLSQNFCSGPDSSIRHCIPRVLLQGLPMT